VTDAPHTQGGAASPRRSAVHRKQRIQLLAAGGGVALVIVFAVLNLNKVAVDWIVTTTNTPLTVVIVVSFLVGVIVGAMSWRHRGKH
jgi:uncharacterized integral membrane protein